MTHGHHHSARRGQHLTHAQSHITWAVAVMESCFALIIIRTHQQGISVGPLYGAEGKTIDLPTSRAKIFSRARSASRRFFCFLRQLPEPEIRSQGRWESLAKQLPWLPLPILPLPGWYGCAHALGTGQLSRGLVPVCQLIRLSSEIYILELYYGSVRKTLE